MSIESVIQKGISFVEHVGQEIMNGLQDGAKVMAKVQPVANFVGNIISAVEPALAPAVKLVLGTATYVEGQFASAGNATGTGEQKAAVVTSMIGDTIAYLLNAAGKASDAASVQAFIKNIVDIGKNDPNIWEELLSALGQAPAAPSSSTSLSAAAAAAAAGAHS